MPDAFLISSILLEFEITVFKYMFGLIVPVKIQRADNQFGLQGLGVRFDLFISVIPDQQAQINDLEGIYLCIVLHGCVDNDIFILPGIGGIVDKQPLAVNRNLDGVLQRRIDTGNRDINQAFGIIIRKSGRPAVAAISFGYGNFAGGRVVGISIHFNGADLGGIRVGVGSRGRPFGISRAFHLVLNFNAFPGLG